MSVRHSVARQPASFSWFSKHASRVSRTAIVCHAIILHVDDVMSHEESRHLNRRHSCRRMLFLPRNYLDLHHPCLRRCCHSASKCDARTALAHANTVLADPSKEEQMVHASNFPTFPRPVLQAVEPMRLSAIRTFSSYLGPCQKSSFTA
jgi:hypothetical protein